MFADQDGIVSWSKHMANTQAATACDRGSTPYARQRQDSLDDVDTQSAIAMEQEACNAFSCGELLLYINAVIGIDHSYGNIINPHPSR